MDKDNRDDFTFAKLSDLKLPVTFRMWVYTFNQLIIILLGRQFAAGRHSESKNIYRVARKT
jgi:hypothetical protein